MTAGGEVAFVLPAGTVSLLLADLEGSVGLWEADRDAMTAAVARLDRLVSDAIGRHGGVRPVEQGEGDSFVAAFSRASDAMACALALQLLVREEDWPGALKMRLRMGLHTGEAQLRNAGNYIGVAINRCARLRDIGHGGQILLSRATHDLLVDRLPEKVTLIDLGSYRLRDLARPEQIYQVCHPDLPSDFPPLRSLDVFPNNLPMQLTSFIGRETEMAVVKGLLSEGRIVTVTGSGGCGKTRLALQVAADLLDEHPDGVWWVDLARISDPGLVPNAVMAALSIKEVAGQLLADTLENHVRTKRAVLILDNCEHVVAAAAELVDALVRACPSLGILATSREPLGVEGEIPWRVPSLSLPDEKAPPAIEPLSQCEAVRLFIDRALRARPNFQVTNDNAPSVARICHRLDGIPLAIELAAARTRMMTPEQIAEGLIDRFRLLTGGTRMVLPRHQTLQASVDWSHNLLSEDERVVFRRLAVFAGGFTLEAAEEVGARDRIAKEHVLELLSRLVDRSLVQVEEAGAEARYRLLETIRQYASDMLAASGEEPAVRTRHLDHYVTLAERAEQELEGAGLLTWSARLDPDHDNLRSAMDWSVESGQADKGVRIGAATWLFAVVVRGHATDVRRRLEATLAAAEVDPALRAKALVVIAQIAIFEGDAPTVRVFGEQALAAADEIGDRRMRGRALDDLGWAASSLDPAGAPAIFEEAARTSEECGDLWWRADALNGLTFVHILTGDLLAAEGALARALAASRANGNTNSLELSLAWRGWLDTFRGDLAAGAAGYEASAALSRELGDRFFTCIALSGLGVIATYAGAYERARDLLEEAMALARESSPFMVAFVQFYQGLLEYAEGDFARAREPLDEALTFFREVEMAWGAAWSLRALGEAAYRSGDTDAARAHLEEALAVARRSGTLWAAGQALQGLARLARAEGEHERAEAMLHEALSLFVTSGFRLDLPELFESLAGLAAEQESFKEAARLFGGAEALHEAIGSKRFAVLDGEYEADVGRVRAGIAEDDLRRAWDEGRAMSLEEAAAYVARGRGERKRPSAGWASLTPTELDVVRLVSEGLTNPQIAERLFVARSTVKVHLSHIFGKLGVATRAELAALATRRGL